MISAHLGIAFNPAPDIQHPASDIRQLAYPKIPFTSEPPSIVITVPVVKADSSAAR
jgi:hypothetical protein